MHDLNVVIIEERVDRVNNKQLILYSRRRTIRIQGDPERPVDYSHIKVTTVQNNNNRKDDEDRSYLIRIKAYRGGGGRKEREGGGRAKTDMIKSSSI